MPLAIYSRNILGYRNGNWLVDSVPRTGRVNLPFSPSSHNYTPNHFRHFVFYRRQSSQALHHCKSDRRFPPRRYRYGSVGSSYRSTPIGTGRVSLRPDAPAHYPEKSLGRRISRLNNNFSFPVHKTPFILHAK